MKLLAIDPGPEKSGWCIFDGDSIGGAGVTDNEPLIDTLPFLEADELAVEGITSYGMPVGAEVFETCIWIGRYLQQWKLAGNGRSILIYRKDVKLHLCGTTQAKDANVRQAIIDRFPRTGGGKTPQIGTKAAPGPLYRVSSHAWSALAVAITAFSRR